MAESAKTIEISILGRNYKIACEEGEREALLEAVNYLDGNFFRLTSAAIKRSSAAFVVNRSSHRITGTGTPCSNRA